MQRIGLTLAALMLAVAPLEAQESRFRIGAPFEFGGTTEGMGICTLDQTTDACEWIFQAEHEEPIEELCFRYHSRAGTPPTYRVSLQGVGSTGNPDGTVLGGGTPASATFTPPADNTWNTTGRCVTLSNSYTPSRGQMLAYVIDYSSGTVNGSNFSQINSVNQVMGQLQGLPYYIENNGGSRNRSAIGFLMWYRTDTRSYGQPLVTYTATSIDPSSTPDEYAIKCTGLMGDDLDYRILGGRAFMRTPGSTGTLLIQLYNGTTAIQNLTLDSDHTQVANGIRVVEWMFDESDLEEIDAAQEFRVGFAPQTAGASWALHYVSTQDAEDTTAWDSPNCSLSTRTDGGAWSDTATGRPIIEFLVEPVAAAGGGGATSIPFIAGLAGPAAIGFLVAALIDLARRRAARWT